MLTLTDTLVLRFGGTDAVDSATQEARQRLEATLDAPGLGDVLPCCWASVASSDPTNRRPVAAGPAAAGSIFQVHHALKRPGPGSDFRAGRPLSSLPCAAGIRIGGGLHQRAPPPGLTSG